MNNNNTTVLNVLNLTMHESSAEEIAAGVFEPEDKALVRELLLFTECPSRGVVDGRADCLAALAEHEVGRFDGVVRHVMIGGASYLMAPLAEYLRNYGLLPVFAFSERVSEERTLPSGGTHKVSVFKHKGWVNG